ncbi:zinc finger protein 771 [Drosophila sechellia]|uniref:GM12485 n=1 Tax=Drosophila sechellia TaxID=7238 RepID=B4I0B6_DROSE|nr:zinc finger protein 771 [Drosophila sechellia]EDW52947.1 GM12485 [Drosophila sechellia]
MNAKRVKYSMVKEEVVPVLIEQETEVDPEEEPEEEPEDDEEHVQDDDGQETQYTYAYTTGDDDDTETAVVTLSDRDHEALVNAEEVIIDENGHAVTLQELVENSTVEEVETIEQGDGTHTILHIVPNIHGEEVEEDEELEDGEEIENDDEIVTVDHEGAELEVEDDEVGSIVFESTIDHAEQDPYGRNKTFYCPNCGNCYSAAGSLKLHMRACLRQRNEISSDERKCKVCSKVFNSVAYLKEHMMRHTGEQPFRCPRCYRKFVEEGKYTAHMESHKHQDKLEAEAVALAAQHGGKKVVVKEFQCAFCSQNFTVVFDVGQVKRRYACDACRDKYSNAEALRQHKQQVEEKREFSCVRCGRKFVFEGFLQRHLPTCDGSIKRRRDMK